MSEITDLHKEIADGEVLQDMKQNSMGWKVIEGLINEARQQAFETWSDLDAGDENKAKDIRAREKVLRWLFQEIQGKIDRIIAAKERIKELEDQDHQEQARIALEDSVPEEVRKLTDPSISTLASLKHFWDNLAGVQAPEIKQ